MKTKFKDVEEAFKNFLKVAKISDKKYILKGADVRLGRYCGIFKVADSGGISPIVNMLTYGELIQWMDGFSYCKYKKLSVK